MKIIFRKIARSDKATKFVRQSCLHTAALGFSLDLAHTIMGKAMIFATWYEAHHEVTLSWSAFAATIIVYLDGHREKLRHELEREREKLQEHHLQPSAEEGIVQ